MQIYIGDKCIVVDDHKRPVNVYGYDPKVGSKHACIVDIMVVYDEPKADIFLIHQAIEIKGLDHHLLCPMHCCMKWYSDQ